jgi:hypothetical protein
MDACWERRPDEPARWYERFLLYRNLGPGRTLAAAYALAVRQEGLATPRLPARWSQIAATWQWETRSAAWDVWRATQPDMDDALPVDPDRRRVAMIERLLGVVYDVIVQADLRGLSEAEARRVLPTLRGLLHDLLRAHQNERQRLHAEDRGALPPFSADELRQAQRELLGAEFRPVTAVEPSWLPLRDVLASLYGEESSARRVAAQAHLEAGKIAFGPRALECWHAILSEAAHSGQVHALIKVALMEYAGNADLHRAVLHYSERGNV